MGSIYQQCGSEGGAGDKDKWARNSLLKNDLAEESAALRRDWDRGGSGGRVSLMTTTSRSLGLGAMGFVAVETPFSWSGELERRCDGDGGCDGASLASGRTSGSAPACALCFFFFFRFFGVMEARASGRGISSTSEILLVGFGLDGGAVTLVGEEAARDIGGSAVAFFFDLAANGSSRVFFVITRARPSSSSSSEMTMALGPGVGSSSSLARFFPFPTSLLRSFEAS